ncbi:hypothetical protein SSABA_v1c09020 [Spiroplasma sabaudiense Ar-1343]|uniref:Uncharacterized protein n=1 Tax=Spiroplasma sabaudiense Ar-1343 TaxID=1276257 RepID=W6ABD3_9MOLU|nr:ribosome-inactivating family protein [Spiroplasma sabaudiense]AHI54301.1 hypothetical protein SSABA_v1c09020 [Spiroplasma sabaudiense Ar-1343]
MKILISLLSIFTVGHSAISALTQPVATNQIEKQNRVVTELQINFDDDEPVDCQIVSNVLRLRDNEITRTTGVQNSIGQEIDLLTGFASNRVEFINLTGRMANGQSYRLIMNPDTLYIDGIVAPIPTGGGDRYYYFNDSVITSIPNTTAIGFGFPGNYNNLIGSQQLIISRNSLENAFYEIIKFNGVSNDRVKKALVQIIFATSEAMRFFNFAYLTRLIWIEGGYINWQTQIRPDATRWGDISDAFLDGYEDEAKEKIAVLKAPRS